MSDWMNFDWNKKTISRWEKVRVNGRKRYIIKTVCLHYGPFYFGVMMFYFYQTYKSQWLAEGGTLMTAVTLLTGAIASGYFTASWIWNETESSYLKHIKHK